MNTLVTSLSENHHAAYDKAVKQAVLIAKRRFGSAKNRFRRTVQRVIGGMPTRAYVLTMKVKYDIKSQRHATYTREHTYIYKSKTSNLKHATIDAGIHARQRICGLGKRKTSAFSRWPAYLSGIASAIVTARDSDNVAEVVQAFCELVQD